MFNDYTIVFQMSTTPIDKHIHQTSGTWPMYVVMDHYVGMLLCNHPLLAYQLTAILNHFNNKIIIIILMYQQNYTTCFMSILYMQTYMYQQIKLHDLHHEYTIHADVHVPADQTA